MLVGFPQPFQAKLYPQQLSCSLFIFYPFFFVKNPSKIHFSIPPNRICPTPCEFVRPSAGDLISEAFRWTNTPVDRNAIIYTNYLEGRQKTVLPFVIISSIYI